MKTKRAVRSVAAIMTITAMVTFTGCNANKVEVNERYSLWSEPVAAINIENLYKVDAHLYRSAQPDGAGCITPNAIVININIFAIV
ncbi:MAG: hypothetical protein MUP09_09955 [Thiovulaceae bacterium]|nr:hypothetical protein [Sulfurimonadaceae bacterium]